MSDRDKFLTEAMGECWHQRQGHGTYLYYKNSNFSTWQGFGKLWEWAQKQNWWFDFVGAAYDRQEFWGVGSFVDGMVHPDRFADAVYEFLREG